MRFTSSTTAQHLNRLNLDTRQKTPSPLLKDAVKSVLRIGSAHNKGGPTDVNIAQILHLLNFF
jgi:hypothetical protein